MKRFIWVLLLAGAAFFIMRHYPELERRARALTGRGAPESAPSAAAAPAAPAVAPATAPAATAPGAPVPVTAPADPTRGAPAKSAEETALEQKYPLPKFAPIEQLTGNWKAIPATAFPREITLKAAVGFAMAAGTSSFPAGSKVQALSAANGQVTVAPNAQSPLRGVVALEQTDIKELLAAAYERFKKKQSERVLAMRTQARKAAAEGTLAAAITASVTPVSQEVPPAVLAKIGPKPPQNADGSVPAMVSSVSAKQVTDFAIKDVRGWSPVRYEQVDGEDYWTSAVRYEARTIFGDFPTEALALMRQGKVHKWIYAGTHEPVP